MEPTQQDLQDAGCWFDSDKGGTSEMTAFKREARWRQHRWAVDTLSITTFGTHRRRQTDPDVPAEEIRNGTKLVQRDADAGSNFLTPTIHKIAKDRAEARQDHQTLDATRLHRDLLSSMPMAFNLFGEASLPENVDARSRLGALFGVETAGHSDIVFEWSPGRTESAYTRDRTAFDVALRIGDPTGPRTVVGIETKYHEHSTKETTPSAFNSKAALRYQEQTDFLVALAEESGVFKPGWQEHVLATDLRQIWRDHLLALSMRRHPQRWTPQTRYVLIYPERNVSFQAATRAYADLLVDPTDSFQAVTIEHSVNEAFNPESPTKEQFRARYLW